MRIVVIGAGFGGVAAAALLLRAGFDDLLVVDRAADVGGVWRDNSYPGCACDIPAALYSFSFAPNPDWSRRFPPHTEILDYLRACVHRLGLAPHLRLNTDVVAARWDDATSRWHLSTADGGTLEADVLVPATGQLSRPYLPDLPGAERYRGHTVHTARWDPTLDLTGRRVGVIGTGASAVQLVPAIADRAGHVTVFQRTPAWTLPKPTRRYGRAERALRRRIPALMTVPRGAAWTLTVVTGRAVRGHRLAGALVQRLSTTRLRRQVRDPELRARLTPGYPMGCKRVLFTDDWYPALQRPDVDLVDHEVTGLGETGVCTDDGTEHPCDVVVYCTGFRATEFLAPLEVVGPGGLRLADAWADGASAYLGITIPGFPNLFLMYGPNTNTGNTSVVYFHESQARYLVQAVQAIDSGRGPVQVSPDVARRFDDEMRERLAHSVWVGCDNWYRTPSGRVVTNWPGSALEYRRRTARFDPENYR